MYLLWILVEDGLLLENMLGLRLLSEWRMG
jgi:hypothetical protein